MATHNPPYRSSSRAARARWRRASSGCSRRLSRKHAAARTSRLPQRSSARSRAATRRTSSSRPAEQAALSCTGRAVDESLPYLGYCTNDGVVYCVVFISNNVRMVSMAQGPFTPSVVGQVDNRHRPVPRPLPHVIHCYLARACGKGHTRPQRDKRIKRDKTIRGLRGRSQLWCKGDAPRGVTRYIRPCVRAYMQHRRSPLSRSSAA